MLTEPTLCLLPQEKAALAPTSLLFHTLGPASLWPLGAGMGFCSSFQATAGSVTVSAGCKEGRCRQVKATYH